MPRLKPSTPTFEDLKAVARRLHIKGFSKLNKCDLQKAIDAHKSKEEPKEVPKEVPKVKPKKKITIFVKQAKQPERPEPRRSVSPTRIDRAKIKEARQFNRRDRGRQKFRTKTPYAFASESYVPF